MSGVIERTNVSTTSFGDVTQALARLRHLPVIRELVKNHLWSGGWGFLKPPDSFYAVAVIAIVFAFAIALVRRRRPIARAIWPLVAVMAAYLLAMAVHMVNGAIAALKDPTFPTIGAEGWYLDEMRTMEACVIAAIAVAAISSVRRAAQLLIIMLIVVNVAGTLFLLLPHWSGFGSGAAGFDVYRAAIEAAPIHRFAALPLLIAAGWLAALVCAITVAARSRRASRDMHPAR